MISRRLIYALLLLAALAAGLTVRFGPVRLPPFFYKYLGSGLWAIGVYLMLATLAPRMRPVKRAFAAALISTAVEFFKLLHQPAVDAFRLTLAGKVLLGRFFSAKDLLAYYLAIAVVWILELWVLDRIVRGRHSGRQEPQG